jgi:outer membrane lipoprotein carrier protein
VLRVALLFVASAVLALDAAQPAAPSPSEIAAAVQRRYDTVRDFSANFEQTYRGGVLRKTSVERGTVKIKKPARMRWEYEHPEKKTFVSDGSQLYSYVPADKQVAVSPVPEADQATTAVLFLAGKGNLLRDFMIGYGPAGPAGTLSLKLTPKKAEREYDWLTLVVDAGSYQIRSLSTADSQGGQSTFVFTNLKENVGLADTTFAFKIPRGVDVFR